jgi:5-methylcytosine-specific restriction endonuclease McrA
MDRLAEPAHAVWRRGTPDNRLGSVADRSGPAAVTVIGESAPLATVSAIGGRVLVLNASYEPINVCTVRRAAVLLLKRRAELLERSDERLHSEHFEIERPVVIRLLTYVRIPRDIHRRKITRKAVLARDSWTCQYCGSTRSGLTVDHVIPRSRGGLSVWDNIVAACAPCNRRKGNRLPAEIEMHPASKPKAPGPTVFIRIAAPRVPASWEPYLSSFAAA